MKRVVSAIARRVDLELVGQVLADQREDLVAGHGAAHVDARIRTRPRPRRSAPAASERRVRAADARRPRRPRAASRIACAMPSRAEAPVGDDAEPRAGRAGTRRPAPSGSSSSRSPRSAGAAAAPPAFARGLERRRVADRRRAASATSPSISFSATLPVKPSVTTTSASPVVRSRPSTLPTKSSGRSAARAASAACASTTVGVPFSAPRRPRAAPRAGARRRARPARARRP